MDKAVYWIWLSTCFSIGSGKPGQLTEEYDPEYIYNNVGEICSKALYLTEDNKKSLQKTSLKKAESIYKSALEKNIRVITGNDDEYPEKLKHIYSAPIVLYVQGDISYLNDSLKITMVGTRKASDYGKKVAGNLSYVLSLAGAVIVSGCAVGIDEFAHRGAIKARARTVGVLACGHGVNYPTKTAKVKEEILMNGGALISELPPGTGVMRGYFPARNRIMAGISDGVVVTEAPVKSGSLITAQLANDMNRDVFCVPPCDIHNEKFFGVVSLLRDGARAVYDATDILEEYTVRYEGKLDLEKADKFSVAGETTDFLSENEKAPAKEEKAARDKQTPENLTDKQKKIYSLMDEEPVHVDELTQKSGLACYEVLSVLTELELLDIIKAHSGRRYSL